MIPKHKRPGRQRAESGTVPAPIGGINATRSLMAMAPEEAIYLFNLLPRSEGAQLREGYSEYANGWTGDASAQTVVPFQGSVTAEDRLWVANRQGIWNVTTAGTTAPVQDVTFADNGTGAGICSFVQYITDADGSWLLVCDGRNGYYVYQESTGTWSKPTQGAGAGQINAVNPADFSFVTVWKERVFFVERDTGYAWYLDNGSIFGTATRFNFGRNFRYGGELRTLVNWTLDGGEGLDDHLVAISGAGDITVYKGTSPVDFGLIGAWNIGKVPAGNRISVSYGGELFLLSIGGLFPMSQLFQGAAVQNDQVYLTYKISPFLRNLMKKTVDDFGWQVYLLPNDGGIAVGTPPVPGEATVQFLYDFGTKAWGISRDIYIANAANWRGFLYFTDAVTNKLWYENGVNVDKVHLDPATDGPAKTIVFSTLSSYQSLDTPGLYKRVQFLRPIWLGGGIPVFDIQARYDFDVAEVLTAPPIAGALNSGIWDGASSTWDLAVWGGSVKSSSNARGANGLGRHVAVAMRGQAAEAVTLIGIDVIWDVGGAL